ncbi:alanine racemase [Sphingosinicella microcystinivorans]|uniref:Alanine racemase n=1 Tax=Sphingosinicella microcystinivorans TaxID=335406 RepID=A0AAD1D4I0_SPHMI|nr:alanine racemase [Sphingosinicella microcystinivorans]RKS85407.1 D-serine deaminase-like pyridoxal phosphate-dependent protein [Sphingosinicella microcystinivorans]BBE33304.1 alanine racemase [Sphingosinicella microcystinivorans]
MKQLLDLETPALLLDRDVMRANLTRMADRIHALGCDLRPHVKTHKSLDVLRDVKALSRLIGITVSTLHEADYFFAGGEKDILYAVGLTPGKVSHAATLIRAGCDLTVISDSPDAIEAIQAAARAEDVRLPVLIELDVDGHRSGVEPDGPELIEMARRIAASANLDLKGVMTHAGGSYDCRSVDQIRDHAARERGLTVGAAERLRDAGHDCPVVSIGSTPTAMFAEDLSGVTEVRPGVYTFFDLFQAGLGVARLSDIAVSVLGTVIGHKKEKGWVIIDAGWMAMSRDRGTANQPQDQGYGVVCDLDGRPIEDVYLGIANQEHGIVIARPGEPDLDVGRFPIGSRLRILPNHACATSAQHNRYEVLEDSRVVAEWPRTHFW